jgi:dihydropteroate synthase
MDKTMKIGSRMFPLGERTYIMGILNITPDSFSDGGKHNVLQQAVERALEMVEEGADIIDVGGESTRPNYTMISEEEEISRVIPVIEAIRKETDIPISIDTYKSKVAEAACKAGANLINDIWGLRYDSNMAGVAVKNKLPVCLMHNRRAIDYKDFYEDLASDIKKSIEIALESGMSREDIIIDPGIGFAKTYDMNLYLLNHLERLHELGYPIILGASRKSVIGLTLNEPVENRLEGTLASTVIAVMKGVQFIRVHDVRENIRAIRMVEAIMRQTKLESNLV